MSETAQAANEAPKGQETAKPEVKPQATGEAAKGQHAKPAEQAAAPNPEEKAEREARKIALMKKEAARIAAQQAQFEESKKAHDTELSTLKETQKQWEEIRALVSKNPLEALRKLGMDFGALVDFANAEQELEVNPAMREVRELKAKIAEQEKREAALKAKQEKDTYDRMRSDNVSKVENFLKANPDRFEFLLATDEGAQQVFDTVYEQYLKTAKKDAQGNYSGPIPDISAIADNLEAAYEQAFTTRMAKLKKVVAHFTAAPAPVADDKAKAKPQIQMKPKEDKSPVLTNSNTSGPVTGARLTKKEMQRRAWEVMKGASATA